MCDQRVRWLEPSCPPQDLRQVAQAQIGGEVLRRRQWRAGHFQAFDQVGHALVAIDQGPARLPKEFGGRASGLGIEGDARAGHGKAACRERRGQGRVG